VHAVVAEVFAHGAARIGRQELERRGIGRGGRHDDGVFHGAGVFERFYDLRHRGALLADDDVDAVKTLVLVTRGVVVFLVEDRVERHGGFAGLAVANDQFALAAANRDQRIERFQAGLHRLVHRLARDDARRLDLDLATFGRFDLAFTVDRVAQGIDHTTEQAFADRHVHDGAGPLDRVALFDAAVVAEDHDTDVVGLEVQRHPARPVGELDHFTGLDVVEAVNAGDTIAHGKNLTNLRDFGFTAKVLDLLFENRRDFCGADIHQPAPFIANLRFWSFVRSELSIMREPTLTTRPPRSEGSTLASI